MDKKSPYPVAQMEQLLYLDYPTHKHFGTSVIPYSELIETGDVGRGVIRGYHVFGLKNATWHTDGKANGLVVGPRFVMLLHSSQKSEPDDRLEAVIELTRHGREYVNGASSFQRRYIYLTLGTRHDTMEIYRRSVSPLRLASWAAKNIGPAVAEYFEAKSDQRPRR